MVMPTQGAPTPTQSKPSAGAIKAKLMQLLNQASQVAQQNGLDFNQILQEFVQGRGGQAGPPPPPGL